MKHFLSCLAILVVGSPSSVLVSPAEPIDIRSRRQLLVDDYLIDRFVGKAELRLHRPVQREVVFTCDKPWEGNWSGLVTFIQDGDLYRMYYLRTLEPDFHFSFDSANHRVASDAFIDEGWKALKALRRSTPHG